MWVWVCVWGGGGGGVYVGGCVGVGGWVCMWVGVCVTHSRPCSCGGKSEASSSSCVCQR